MATVIVTNIVSLDGCFEGPGGNVMALNMDEAFDAYNRERMEAADGVLLGRTSWEGFGSYWPGIADAPEDPDNRALSEDNRRLSRTYNRRPKVVVSDTCVPAGDHPWFDTTTVVPRDEIAGWLAGHDGEYVVYGSHVMWNGLLEQGLVDELHLMVSPQVLGDGTPAFVAPTELTLLETRRFDGSSNVLLRYSAGLDTAR